MSDFQKPKRVKHALNNPKLRISAPNPAVKGVYSTLAFDVYQNNPRIVVDTKDPSLANPDNGYGRITAALDPTVFGVFLEFLDKSIKSDGATKFKIENYGFEYVNGQRSQEAAHLSDVWVGKEADGTVFISVISKKPGFPTIKFPFGLSDQRWHKIYHGDGTQFTKAELSEKAAAAYLRLLTNLVPNVLDTHYYDAPPNTNWKNKGNGGGYGGNRGGNGGGGGYNKPAPAAADLGDDDLPF